MSPPNATAQWPRRNSVTRRPLWWLLAFSCLVKLVYVFAFTDYPHYLFSDFGGYWERAMQRYQGVDRDEFQWAVWPPMAHIFLSWLFHVIDALGLRHWRLETVLTVNILLSTAGVACLYSITRRLTSSSRAALVVATVYAFWYPLVYFNAFVMSEHPATAALLFALWLLVRFPGYPAPLLLAGGVLGVAVGMRPAFGLMALPCGLFVLLGGPFAKVSVKHAAAFSIGFVVVIAAIAAEVNRISNGQLLGLSANGGVNFYFAQCRTREVVSSHAGATYWLIPPATADRLENGRIVVKRPFHDQAFFSDLGWQCVRAQPDLWWRNFLKLHDLFLGPLFPSAFSAIGFRELLPVFQWAALVVACTAPLGFVAARHARRRRIAALLGGVVAVAFATQYAFNAEHRYLYPVFGLLLALVAWSVVWVYRAWPKTRVALLAYGAVVGTLGVVVGAHAVWQRVKTPERIEAQWHHAKAPFSESQPAIEGQFGVDTLRFPPGRTLRHPAHGDIEGMPEMRNVAIRFTTCLDVATAGRFEFIVVSGDGFELRIDERFVAARRQEHPYRATHATAYLGAGRHRYSLLYHQATDALGVTAIWRRAPEEGGLMPAVGLRDVGESGDGVRFLPPGECGVTRQGG